MITVAITPAMSQRLLQLACAVALLAGAALTQAQTSSRSVHAVPRPPAPVLAPGSAGPAAPRAAGLPSPIANPAGLESRFPAGLPSPDPSPAGLPSPAVPNLASPGTAAGSPPIDAGVAPPTQIMGAGAAGYGGVPSARQSMGVGPAPLTALQIAQSFLGADVNRDGELTRAEAQRLTVMPYGFEEIDRNHDGILSRFEYEDGVR